MKHRYRRQLTIKVVATGRKVRRTFKSWKAGLAWQMGLREDWVLVSDKELV